MLKQLSIGWTAWQLARRRFGRVGAFVTALAVVAGYVVLTRWLRENHPDLAETVE